MNQIIKKPLPSNQEAEQSVLGSILIDGKVVFTALSNLGDQDFYSSRHRLIFQAMIELARSDEDLNVLTVADYLKRIGKLEDCGGVDYLTELEEVVPTSQAISHHCRVVKEKSILRGSVKVGQNLMTEAWEETGEPKTLIETAQNELYGLSLDLESRGKRKHVYAPEEWAQSVFDSATEWSKDPSQIRGIQTGMNRLDLILKGLKDLNIISASTGHGKTAVGLNWAINIGIHQKIPCLYLNFEMSLSELSLRVLGILSGIPTSMIFAGRYTEHDPFSKVEKAAQIIKDGKLFLTGNEPKNINTAIALIHQYRAQHGIQVVLIDYLGEIEPDNLSEKENSEYRTFGRWVQTLKNVCVSLGVKLVLLAQLNREGEDSPKMSKVGGSWKIAQKADVFLIIKREKGQDFLHVAKNRNGKEKLDIDIDFNRETQRVIEI